MNRPGSALWLMRHELRLVWRRGKLGPKTGLIIALALLAGWAVVSFLIARALGPALPPPPLGDTPYTGPVLIFVSLGLAFMASVMTSQAILGVVDAIYTRNDLDLLLSSPLTPWTVLIVRTASIAIGALPLYMGLLGVPLIWLAIFSSPLWLSGILVVLGLAFAATGIALLVVTLLFRAIGAKRTRTIAQLVSAFAGGAVFLAFQYFNITGRRSQSAEDMMLAIGALDLDTGAPWFIPASAAAGDLGALILWIAFCVLLFPLGVFVFSRRFVEDAAAASASGSSRRRRLDARVNNLRGGLSMSVIRKELRLLRRDPVLLSQIGLQLVYLLPLAFILIQPAQGIDLGRYADTAFAPALTILSSTLAGSLIWITVSAEDAPDLIAAAPVSRRLVDRAKLVAAVGPVLALMAIPVALLLLRSPVAGAWAAVGCVAAGTSAGLIGVWRKNPGSRKAFMGRRRQPSLAAGLGQMVVSMGWASAAGLGAYGLPWLAIIPAILAASVLAALQRPPPALP